MGALSHPFPADDDVESGMLNQQFTMQALGELPQAAGETFTTSSGDVGPSVGVAVLNPIPSGFTLPQVTLPQPNTGVPAKTAGGGGAAGGGGGTVPNLSTAGAGIFGDLFGPSTDTIVIGVGLLVVAGLGFMLMKGKRGGGAPMRRRARA